MRNLSRPSGRRYVGPMSANEVLQQVKELPPQERRKFFDCVRELETGIEVERASPSRGELAGQLMGAGRRWLKPGADPVGDLIRRRGHNVQRRLIPKDGCRA
jgi:hypothetical protein